MSVAVALFSLPLVRREKVNSPLPLVGREKMHSPLPLVGRG
jgi:hypothetical protein